MKQRPTSGRVPHVRPSVRGTKTMGRSPFERFSLDARDTIPERAVRTKVKAFEDVVFGPCTLRRTRISCYAAPGQNRVCGFLRGKPHAAQQRHQPRQEIRGTWGTPPE